MVCQTTPATGILVIIPSTTIAFRTSDHRSLRSLLSHPLRLGEPSRPLPRCPTRAGRYRVVLVVGLIEIARLAALAQQWPRLAWRRWRLRSVSRR